MEKELLDTIFNLFKSTDDRLTLTKEALDALAEIVKYDEKIYDAKIDALNRRIMELEKRR